MRTQSIDTDINAEEFLISLIRKASTSRKMAQVRSLSKTTIQLSKRAIARANKDLDERELDLLFVEYHYGNDLANRIKKYLEKINRENS